MAQAVVKDPSDVVVNESDNWFITDLADLGDENDGTFVSDNGNDNAELQLNFQDFPEAIVITSCVLLMRIRANAGETGFGRIHADVPGFSRQTLDISTFGDGLENKEMTVTDLVAKTTAVFNDSKFGFECYNHSGTFNQAHVAEFHATVTYELAAGGFAFLIGQYLGPLVCVALHELPKIAALMRRGDRRRRLAPLVIEQHEYERAWRELRECAVRRWFDLAVPARP